MNVNEESSLSCYILSGTHKVSSYLINTKTFKQNIMKTRLISLNRPKWLSHAEKEISKRVVVKINSGITDKHRIVREG